MSENAMIEKKLGITPFSAAREQIQAAYALNLCAVSVSQIIDYNDINVLDQEYEAILNNLNLEYMPKDEALLDIIKRILETITFFRIQEREKNFIEKDYQQEMKNAIWSAMPNPGALIAGGLGSGGAGGHAVSLAASVGTAYMNYRKKRAECQSERERRQWELKRTALEQLQTLQQQLFETSWRLADKYGFPDALRLSERQIKQYNAILMDADEIRKYERLDAIKNKFAAYPPFWYYFGNTANRIALNPHYGLSQGYLERKHNYAKTCFEYFTQINKYNLLREDGITASCNLEYADLLLWDSLKDSDEGKEKTKIKGLLDNAVEMAGNSMDILQLCAVAYMRNENEDDASRILRGLVNEQYNEVMNAQLLSSIYVKQYIDAIKAQNQDQNEDIKSEYQLLKLRVNPDYLFPLPDEVENVDREALGESFVKMQKDILQTKYGLVLIDFAKKYQARINRIVPIPEAMEHFVADEVYADKASAREERIHQVQEILYNKRKNAGYKSLVDGIMYSYEVLEVLNKMFASICRLECVQDEETQLKLRKNIQNSIMDQKETLQKIDSSLSLEKFDENVYRDVQKITLQKLAGNFFESIVEEITRSTDKKTEMGDFVIAEQNLAEFCKTEGIAEPEILFAHKDDADADATDAGDTISDYFTLELIGESADKQKDWIDKKDKMKQEIKKSIEGIVCNAKDKEIDVYIQEDGNPAINRYFYKKKYIDILPKTLAVLDDHTGNDRDLVFTTEGLMPVIKGKGKKVIPYKEINWSQNPKKKELDLGVKYSNDNLDMDKLYNLIITLGKLSPDEPGHADNPLDWVRNKLFKPDPNKPETSAK